MASNKVPFTDVKKVEVDSSKISGNERSSEEALNLKLSRNCLVMQRASISHVKLLAKVLLLQFSLVFDM